MRWWMLCLTGCWVTPAEVDEKVDTTPATTDASATGTDTADTGTATE